MMKYKLIADNPAPDSPKELVMTEKAWRPIRSLMAIANQRIKERDGLPVALFREMQDMDDNIGHRLYEVKCWQLADVMEELIQEQFTICDYGMTVDIDNGQVAYTYPNEICTSYFEDVETGEFFETLDSPGILGRRVRSWFRATEEEVSKFISFLRSCNGFSMP